MALIITPGHRLCGWHPTERVAGVEPMQTGLAIRLGGRHTKLGWKPYRAPPADLRARPQSGSTPATPLVGTAYTNSYVLSRPNDRSFMIKARTLNERRISIQELR